jgi:drug/metabolite transporter (DMT)-like permease
VPNPSPPRLQPLTLLALVVAVGAVSSSGPIIAYAAAPALAIAFWRNGLSSVLLWPVALIRRRAEMTMLASRAKRGVLLGCVLAGAALSVHFATWVSSVKLTVVADAVALGATQPVWQGLIARAQGKRLPAMTWLGIAVAVAGAVAATGADIEVSGRAVAGDLLAIAGGMAAAVYTALGERVRTETTTIAYTTVCYSVCAVLLLAVCVASGTNLAHYPATTWLALLGLVGGAQLLGHSMFNYALRHVSATTISVLILLEVPGAALLAWWWLGQTPQPRELPGLALVLAGVVVVLLGASRGRLKLPAAEVPS